MGDKIQSQKSLFFHERTVLTSQMTSRSRRRAKAGHAQIRFKRNAHPLDRSQGSEQMFVENPILLGIRVDHFRASLIDRPRQLS
jgi:hypothetical protein